MPGILTACIFSAQRGEATVFYSNSQLLLLLCLVSGISRLIFVICITSILNVLRNWDYLALNDILFLFGILNCSGLRAGCFAIANVTMASIFL